MYCSQVCDSLRKPHGEHPLVGLRHTLLPVVEAILGAQGAKERQLIVWRRIKLDGSYVSS